MGSNSTYIDVSLKSYDTGYQSEITIGSDFIINGAGTYDMKMVNFGLEFSLASDVSIGSPLYGSDTIKFGMEIEYDGAGEVEFKYLNTRAKAIYMKQSTGSAEFAVVRGELGIKSDDVSGVGTEQTGVDNKIKNQTIT